MSTAEPKRQPYLFGLLLLVFGNLILFLVWCFLTNQYYQASLGLPLILMSLESAIMQSQRAIYGIAAALIPQRRFVGLVWALGLGLITGLIHAEFLNLISVARSGTAVPLEWLWAQTSAMADQTMAMFALTQGLRIATGWRLAPADGEKPRTQFHIADILELTTSICAWLAINRLVALDFAILYQYSIGVLGMALITLPIAFVATSQQGLSTKTFLFLLAWAAVVEAFFLGLSYVIDPAGFTRPWSFYLSSSIGHLIGSLLFTALNFWIISRLGFRWRRSPVALQTPA